MLAVFRPDVLIHWLHLMAAIIWVGGMVTTAVVVQPALRAMLPAAARMTVYRDIGRRFVAVQWACWTVLLLTGTYKVLAWRGAWAFYWGAYGRVLAVKLSLIAFMAVLSLLHSHAWGPRLADADPASAEFKALAGRMAFWGKVNLACLGGIVFCAALLRIYPW